MKCSRCGRPALVATKKNPKVRSDVEHDLCSRCFRDTRNKMRAQGTWKSKR